MRPLGHGTAQPRPSHPMRVSRTIWITRRSRRCGRVPRRWQPGLISRAATLTPSPATRSVRLLRAVEAWWLGNDRDAAATAADEALTIAEDQTVRADVVLFRRAGRDLGRRPEGGSTACLPPRRTPSWASTLCGRPIFWPRPSRRALRLADEPSRQLGERALAVGSQAEGTGLIVGQAALASAYAFTGAGERTRELAEPLLALAGGLMDVPATGDLLQVAALLADTRRNSTREPRLCYPIPRSCSRDRSGRARELCPYTLGEIELRDSRGRTPTRHATSCRQLCSDAGHTFSERMAATIGARLEAAQGRRGRCASHPRRGHRSSQRQGLGSLRLTAEATYGFLELGLGRIGPALAHLESAAAIAAAHGVIEPNAVKYHGDLIEASVRLGRTEDAARHAAVLEEHADSSGQVAAQAIAARGRGLLAEDEEALREAFEEALGWHDMSNQPFERARTELCFAERLRRGRQRQASRQLVRSALTTFERLGAAPWAQRARNELAAAGEATPRAKRAARARPADATGAAGRPARRPRRHQPGGGRGSVPQRQDRREAPRQRVPQARACGPDPSWPTWWPRRSSRRATSEPWPLHSSPRRRWSEWVSTSTRGSTSSEGWSPMPTRFTTRSPVPHAGPRTAVPLRPLGHVATAGRVLATR